MKYPNLTILNPELKDKNHTDEATKMIIPIRCFSCGKPLGHLWEEFAERTQKGEAPKKIMDSLYIERFCCRSLFIGNVELIDMAGEFKRS